MIVVSVTFKKSSNTLYYFEKSSFNHFIFFIMVRCSLKDIAVFNFLSSLFASSCGWCVSNLLSSIYRRHALLPGNAILVVSSFTP